MNLIEKATLMHYHRHRIGEFSLAAPKALGWRDQHSQLARFAALGQIGSVQGCSVLDIGCGCGDFKAWLDGAGGVGDYIGIDLMPEFIAAAKARFAACGNAAFFQADFSSAALPQVDYVFASGALSYRCADDDYYYAMIARFYQAARLGLAFNMLDAQHFPQHKLLRGHDRAAVLAYCRTLAHRVEIINGYADDDFTLCLYTASSMAA